MHLRHNTGCGMLLDLNNVYVTCENVGGNAFTWCDSLNLKSVGEIHLAGHSPVDADGDIQSTNRRMISPRGLFCSTRRALT